MSSTVRVKIPRLSPHLLTPTRIPWDVTFKIVGSKTDNNDRLADREVLGEIKGHKFFLSAISPVFKGMFFGPMQEKDVIFVQETTFEAFKKMIEFIYQADIDCSNLTLLETYDIVNLAEMYDMPKLMDELKTKMENMPLTKHNLIDVAETATQFPQFLEVSSNLLLTCAKFLQTFAKTPADQLQFALDHLASGRGETALKLVALVKDLPPVECSSCGYVSCLDGEVVTHDKLNQGLRVRINKNSQACSFYNNFFAGMRFTVVCRDDIRGSGVRVREVTGGKSYYFASSHEENTPTFSYDCS